MPQNIAQCSRCNYKYLLKYQEWPQPELYKATYRLDVDDSETDEIPAILRKYWCLTSRNRDGSWTLKYKACDRCARYNPILVEHMEHHPEGWIESRLK